MTATLARRIPRLVVAGAVFALAWTGGVAGAELADDATVTVAPTIGARGSDFTVSGTGCTGENPVAVVEIDGEFIDAVGTASNGSWSLEFTVPDDAAIGPHTVQALCETYDTVDEYPAALFTVAEPPVVVPPTPAPQAAVSASSATAGSTVTVTGTGFANGEAVTVTLFSDPVHLTTVTASATGTVSVAVKIPSSTTAGSHRLELRGTTSGRVASVPVTVTAKASTGSGLARTGSTTDLLAKLAASLILTGVGTIAIATGRRELLS